jgi:hypothetical protein
VEAQVLYTALGQSLFCVQTVIGMHNPVAEKISASLLRFVR